MVQLKEDTCQQLLIKEEWGKRSTPQPNNILIGTQINIGNYNYIKYYLMIVIYLIWSFTGVEEHCWKRMNDDIHHQQG